MSWVGVGVAAGSIGSALITSNSASNSQADATGKAVGETQRQFNTSREDLAPYRAAGTSALTRLQQLLGLPDDRAGQIDWQAYLRDNPDVAAHSFYGSNPQLHYNSFGRDEGRNLTYFQPRAASADEGDLLRKFTSADLNADPVYNSGLEFGLDEGRKAIERRAAAGGGLDSGSTLKALTRFGNDYGTTKAEGAYGRFIGHQGDVYGRLSGIAGLGSGATNVGVNAGSNTASNLASLYTGQGNAAGAAAIASGNAIGGGLNQFANYYSQQNLLQQLQGGGGRTPQAFNANLIGPD